MNKYERIPEFVLDLHGHTMLEARSALDEILENGKYSHIRVITGKGMQSPLGPVLRPFVIGYLQERNIHFNPSKQKDGGEGALEIFPSK